MGALVTLTIIALLFAVAGFGAERWDLAWMDRWLAPRGKREPHE